MFKRIVASAETLALLAIAVFVIMLFANEPDGGGGDDASAGGTGAEVYSARCASCHGSDGGGGIGPRLSDGAVVDAYPDVADEIEVVAEGTGRMPAFDDRLTPKEIERVVEYTRTL